jgi:tetraacyldisaccharide 4'-kinase
VTKCPESLTKEEKEDFIQQLKLQSHQEAFFTKLRVTSYELQESRTANHLLITGIDNPTPLVNFLENEFGAIHQLHFPDHHNFTAKDIEKIIRVKEQLGGDDCTILTTEKDAMRLQAFNNMPEFYTVPIEIVFLEREAVFKEKLLSLLRHDNA